MIICRLWKSLLKRRCCRSIGLWIRGKEQDSCDTSRIGLNGDGIEARRYLNDRSCPARPVTVGVLQRVYYKKEEEDVTL